jgi:SAM-dependent methyltransferase
MSLDGSFFDEFYARHGLDPWGFERRWYERRKRAVTLAALPRERFGRALEVGCAIGVLTAELAPRCDRLLATELSAAAARLARDRLGGAPHVDVVVVDDAATLPAGPFDLVVVSEVLYYLDEPGLCATVDRLDDVLGDDGVLVACHWRHPVAEYPLSGDQVHAVLRQRTGLAVLAEHRERDFLLDVLARDGRSVATREGLVDPDG